MSLIKPTITESLFYQFFKLDPTRPMYYNWVYQLSRSIFLNLELNEKVEQMDSLVWEQIELPFKANFTAICTAFYHPRFMMSKKAYTKIGSGYDSVKVTRFEMETRLENIKKWIYDEVIALAGLVRFTRPAEIYG